MRRAHIPFAPLLCLAIVAWTAPAHAQESKAIKVYMRPADKALIAKTTRTVPDVREVLPNKRAMSFADYIRAKYTREFTIAALRQAVEHQRLNKIIGNTATGGGTTSLVANVAAPGAFGFASEYGAITQKTAGNTTTLRANLLGLVNVVVGSPQFPSCPEDDQHNCQPATRWLRRFSGSTSFESLATDTSSSTPAESPTFSDLLGDNFRLSTWSVRFDWTANDPDDPKYVKAWQDAVPKLRGPEAEKLTEAISLLFADANGVPTQEFTDWSAQAVPLLQKAAPKEFERVLEEQLDALIVTLSTKDPAFWAKAVTVSRTHESFFAVRDEVLKAIQSHQFSSEYVERRPLDQPAQSSFRLVYSHQPSANRPLLITANAAATWYTKKPTVVDNGTVATDVSQFRDLQISGQIDRRLGEEFRESVFTVGAYYQWMKDDALIKFDPDNNTAPGSGIVLTDAAQKVLTSKGHIGVVQMKLTIPITGVVKVPVSVTWSNRTEIVTELEKKSVLKAQVGFTIDLDGILKGG